MNFILVKVKSQCISKNVPMIFTATNVIGLRLLTVARENVFTEMKNVNKIQKD